MVNTRHVERAVTTASRTATEARGRAIIDLAIRQELVGLSDLIQSFVSDAGIENKLKIKVLLVLALNPNQQVRYCVLPTASEPSKTTRNLVNLLDSDGRNLSQNQFGLKAIHVLALYAKAFNYSEVLEIANQLYSKILKSMLARANQPLADEMQTLSASSFVTMMLGSRDDNEFFQFVEGYYGREPLIERYEQEELGGRAPVVLETAENN